MSSFPRTFVIIYYQQISWHLGTESVITGVSGGAGGASGSPLVDLTT